MPNREIIHYIKNETNTDDLYHIAVTCIEMLLKRGQASAIKAILDSGTSALVNMIKK